MTRTEIDKDDDHYAAEIELEQLNAAAKIYEPRTRVIPLPICTGCGHKARHHRVERRTAPETCSVRHCECEVYA